MSDPMPFPNHFHEALEAVGAWLSVVDGIPLSDAYPQAHAMLTAVLELRTAVHTPLVAEDLWLIMHYYKAASQPPVSTILLPDDEDPVEWFRDCLSKNMHQEVYGVAMGTPDALEGQEALVTALTGNGPKSKANADFYALCHTAIPALVAEIRRLWANTVRSKLRHG